MFLTSIILFAIAALGGATLAVLRLMNKPLPISLAVIHGLFAAAGLILLIVAMIYLAVTNSLVTSALILFIIAAIGGAILFFFFHLRNKSLPIVLVLGHGLLAIIGFIVFLMYVARM